MAKKTLLLYCEGADEKVFLDYLKTLFSKDSGTHTEIKDNHGGGANDALVNVAKQIPADVVVCIYDTDRGVDADLKKRAGERKILCVENSPCLEAFLLNILENKDYTSHPTDACKKRFEKNYLDGKKRSDKRNYEKIFPKDMLIKQAKRIENLKMLIDLIRGK